MKQLQQQDNEKRTFKTASFDLRNWKKYFNKRTALMCAMLAVLVTTGMVSLRYSSMAQEQKLADVGQTLEQEQPLAQVEPAQEVVAQDSVSTFFSDYRTERNSVRAQEVAYLDSIIQNRATEQSVLSQAQERKIELTSMMEQEVTVEGLLRAKGFSDVIVTLSDASVNVVVSESVLSEAQAAQILQIVMDETGKSAQNVKIIPAG